MEQDARTAKHVILVVDDDPTIRKAIRRVLKDEFGVLQAGGRSEAETILEGRSDIGLVISDCQMEEGYSGVELLRRLKNERPGIGRVLVSGSLEVKEAQEMVENRTAHVYMAKPWKRERLLEAVRGYFSEPPKD